MVKKQPIFPEKVRKIPKRFSWVDQRLVSEHYIERCSHEAMTLYLFLVIVSDSRGLSYYSDGSICVKLGFKRDDLLMARGSLKALGLIGYEFPIYQVLSLDVIKADIFEERDKTALKEPLSIQAVFRKIGEKANDKL